MFKTSRSSKLATSISDYIEKKTKGDGITLSYIYEKRNESAEMIAILTKRK